MDAAAHEEAFVRAMELMEQYLSLQQDLQGYMKAGFFGLAQARYSLGASKVGTAENDKPST